MASLDEVKQLMSTILNEISNLPQKLLVTGVQIKVTALSEISNVLGVIQAGEFRSGNSKDPGRGFSGVRLGYPPFSYSGEMWNFAGVNNDVLQFGISATTGKAYAAGGKVILDANGVTIQADETTPYLTFKDENGVTVATIFQDGAGNLQHDLAVADQLFTFNDGGVVSSQHNNKIPAFALHYGYAEKGAFFWSPSDSHISVKNSVANGSIYFNVEGSGGGDGIRLWDANASAIVWKVNQNGAMHLKALSSKPSYVDGWAILYLYSDGAGNDVVQLRTKIGATETETTIQDATP